MMFKPTYSHVILPATSMTTDFLPKPEVDPVSHAGLFSRPWKQHTYSAKKHELKRHNNMTWPKVVAPGIPR